MTVVILADTAGRPGGQPRLSDAIPPVLCLALIAAGAVAALRIERGWVTVAGIALVTLASVVYAWSVEPLLTADQNSDSLVLSFPVVAASVIGVGRRSLAACILICTLGFGIAEAAVLAVAATSGRKIALDYTSVGAVVAVCLLLVVLWTARRDAVREAPALHLAAREEEVIAEEARLLGHASSRLHDTVLGDLQALAMLRTGPIPEGHRAVIRRDIELLDHSDDLLLSPESARLPGFDGERGATLLGLALARVDSRGLRVVMSGDPVQLSHLTAEREEAMVGAIEQCLVNVIVHAGVVLAELAIVATGTEVTAMITDSGRGFVVSANSGDRLGLRLSVTDRLRAVGGSSMIWSTPGSGTSVLLIVPQDQVS
ncbi:sensor histidine kinase [Agreia sp. COWG]|uniref:sensor histidine kinase n=1 Tax=Agreia sp. COWG TaxID=2773266 RepID=UPI0019262F7E|nr:hypothetical protein [Agreia sp. COWG]CAD5992348.1 conserved membrane protein of unknown function [Agreia sp. COWG]